MMPTREIASRTAAIRDAVRYSNSYSRMPTLLAQYHPGDASAWFAVLGEEWPWCDNIGVYRNVLADILASASRADLLRMMTSHEIRELAAMPSGFVVYRGCYDINMYGLSWSLSRGVALRFPTLARYRRADGPPLLLTGKVKKADCVLKLDREEHEIICPRVTLLNVEEL